MHSHKSPYKMNVSQIHGSVSEDAHTHARVLIATTADDMAAAKRKNGQEINGKTNDRNEQQQRIGENKKRTTHIHIEI